MADLGTVTTTTTKMPVTPVPVRKGEPKFDVLMQQFQFQSSSMKPALINHSSSSIFYPKTRCYETNEHVHLQFHGSDDQVGGNKDSFGPLVDFPYDTYLHRSELSSGFRNCDCFSCRDSNIGMVPNQNLQWKSFCHSCCSSTSICQPLIPRYDIVKPIYDTLDSHDGNFRYNSDYSNQTVTRKTGDSLAQTIPTTVIEENLTRTGNIRSTTNTTCSERIYKCDNTGCQKSFSRKEELTRHKRSHSGERAFPCEICKRTFIRKDHMTKHRATHQDVSTRRRYVCREPGCDRRYTRSDALSRHRTSAHAKIARSPPPN